MVAGCTDAKVARDAMALILVPDYLLLQLARVWRESWVFDLLHGSQLDTWHNGFFLKRYGESFVCCHLDGAG